MENKEYRVLLYYEFVNTDEPENFVKIHLEFCKSIRLKGRILVSKEGINGTVSETVEQTN